jgi:hypothetical protein
MGGPAPMGAHMMLHPVPTQVAAGTVSLVVYNIGWRTHELVVLPLPAGAVAGQRVPGANGKSARTAASARRPSHAPPV